MEFQIIDWLVVFAYICLIFFLAFRASQDTHSKTTTDAVQVAKEQYLANKSLTFTESICSIIATEVSALTFLGIPAFAFNKDFSFVQIYVGAIIGRLVIARIFLPRVYDKGLTVYEVMAKDTGLPSGQKVVSIFYTLSKILAVGVRLFSGSILVAHFFQLNIYIGLAVVTFMTFLYTLIGGLKAVVRTDILQLTLFVSGGLVAHYLIPVTAGQSWIDMMTLAHQSGKTSFIDFSSPLPFILGVLGGILFDMATHGVDQDFVQRLTANRDMKHAQWAIFLSSFASIAVGFIFLGVGALLWSFYQSHPFPADVESADHIFAYYIVNYFPVGVRGFMVAGVLAATMSTLDSTINALCACVYNDIFPKRNPENIKFYNFLDTILITALLFAIAVIASKNDGLLLLGLKVQSWTAGSLLAIFMTKIVLKKWFKYVLNPISVFGAYACGTFGVYLNTQILKWDWNLNVYFGFIMACLFLKAYSVVRPYKEVKA